MCPAVPTVSDIAPSAPGPGDTVLLGSGRVDRGGDLVHLRVGQRAHVEQRAAVADEGDHRGLRATQRGRELLLDGAREARELGQGEGAAADSGDGLLDLAADQGGEPLGTRADGVRRLVERAQHRHLAACECRVEVERERSLECGQGQLVGPQGALQRMPAEALDELGAADDEPGLGPAQELVAGEADEVGPAREALGHRRLVPDVEERPGAEVVHEEQAVTSGDLRELRQPRLLGEADDAEVRLVHAQHRSGVGRDGALVVLGPGAIRGADLPQPRPGAGQDLGDAEAVADLDQLAPRDEHLAALRERGEREEHGCGVVVDDKRRLGARQALQDPCQVILARAAAAGVEVVLEVGVSGTDLHRPRERGRGERRAPQIGVHEHAGRVHDAAQARPARSRRRLERIHDRVARVTPRPDLLSRPLQARPRRGERELARQRREPRVGEQAVDGRQVPEVGHCRECRRAIVPWSRSDLGVGRRPATSRAPAPARAAARLVRPRCGRRSRGPARDRSAPAAHRRPCS
jgi:hypothetical protein